MKHVLYEIFLKHYCKFNITIIPYAQVLYDIYQLIRCSLLCIAESSGDLWPLLHFLAGSFIH